jgi:hypothetical protein
MMVFAFLLTLVLPELLLVFGQQRAFLHCRLEHRIYGEVWISKDHFFKERALKSSSLTFQFVTREFKARSY